MSKPYKQRGLCWTPAFLLRDWNFSTWSASKKNPGCWVSEGLPWAKTSHTWPHFCMPFRSWEWESIRKSEHGFLQTLPVSFPRWSSCASLWALVINLSCEYRHVLSLPSPSSESVNVRVVLRILTQPASSFCSNLSSFIMSANIYWAPTYTPGTVLSALGYVSEGEK